ncbi:MAG: dienelactone hydrolase family protein [bacterium]|nr:dienelactone hydrolase family protein [bacterium]
MDNKIINSFLFIFTIIVPFQSGAVNLSESLDKLLRTTNTKEQEQIINQILKEKPSVDSLIALLQNIKFKKLDKIGIITNENLCIDGIKRPFCWYVPSTYDPSKKTPLLIYLHGGISRPDIIEKPEEYVQNSPFIKIADKYNYILLFPLGQFGATWWDSVGVSNVLQQIRITKQNFNIDDNRVFLTGFSDGGSGSFLFAMCYPTDFAAFLPLNGHPGVGSWGGLQTYFINLFNCPLYVISTEKDELYPAKKITPIIELAQSAGANILYRIYADIGHSFDYVDKELPLMVKFMETHPRSLSSIIKWESAYPGMGCMWLSIDSIIAEGHADWYKDYNMELIDDRVMFGFMPDDKYNGPGVRIGKVVGDSTLCAILGIQEGDVLIKLGENPVNNLDDINKYKEDKKCGDWAEMTILRQGQELKLKGQFPGPTKYNLFRRGQPSARLEAYFCGNKFSIKASQVGAFTIYILPDMVQLDQNVVLEVNGRKIFDGQISASPEFLLHNFLKNRDRALIYVNKLFINLKNL